MKLSTITKVYKYLRNETSLDADNINLVEIINQETYSEISHIVYFSVVHNELYLKIENYDGEYYVCISTNSFMRDDDDNIEVYPNTLRHLADICDRVEEIVRENEGAR